MEDKPKNSLPGAKNTTNQLVSPWIPCIATFAGVIFSLFIWHELRTKQSTDLFLSTLSVENQPWLILIISILFTILCAIGIRLIQLSYQHKQLFKKLKHDFNQEIAEHFQAEKSKKQLEIALLEGQKLQAIGTLAGGIAHDFNNILYAIIGYVEMAREDAPQDSTTYTNLGRVLEASQRGQDLVARILDFGRRNQHYEQKPITINIILEDVLGLMHPTIPSSVRINLIGTENNLVILGNQTQLHQVIVNIIINAVDAMYGEGTITIDISKASSNDDELKQFPTIIDGNYCKIKITDTGHGMDQATLKRIFEPFYTTKEVGKGTGLGLATVHGIITQHHGEILVTSQLGTGTTFTLLLPEYKDITAQLEDTNGNYSFSRR